LFECLRKGFIMNKEQWDRARLQEFGWGEV
jgi:hypothetical protein